MLTSILPGLRDLRGPLTAGYLWLLAAWIAFGDLMPHARPRSGDMPIQAAFDLAGFFGKGAVVAAISFTAYLFGAFVSIDVQSRLGQKLLRLVMSKPVSPPMVDALREFTRFETAQALGVMSEQEKVAGDADE
ncbi:MAG: hypothetical protein JWO79_1472 [Actinomycetia bacterium]|jgi:hypothetical protein|nr:hypothetical protein [Actinomycetes bacterium]MDQ1644345.1 hypothetical protein [Cryptosporangiaceae bacterium]MDQ1655961.1 hypothetical protein [Cryptosporangiaceae bacterium]